MDHAAAAAFDREKRVYKDAYVESFRQVRYFPALASLGAAGRAQGASIVLVQEPAPKQRSDGRKTRSRPLEAVASRLLPPDPLEEVFESGPAPLASFRSAILCKHSKARAEREAGSPKSTVKEDKNDRFGLSAPAVFKPASAVEAKAAIERKITYDGQEFRDATYQSRKFTPRAGVPDWQYNNPAMARKELHGKAFLHEPPEGSIKADRKYTQEFIRMNMEAYHAAQQQYE